jgi:hypothetical protein
MCTATDVALLLTGLTSCCCRARRRRARRAQNQVSAAQARSIIVLSQGGIAPDDADSRTVRQILSLQQIKVSLGYLKGHIVVELQDIDNLAMTKLVGKDDIEVIVSHELIGRLMLLAARSPWIAPVLASVMGFEGAEFYFKEWPELVGASFGSIYYRFDDAVPVGIKRAGDGLILINPSDDEVICAGDQILALAEDDDSYCVNDVVEMPAPPKHAVEEDRAIQRASKPPEKMLFCGWRRDMADMINELDYDVQAGSELWLFNNVPMNDRELKLLDKGNKAPLKLKNLKIRHAVGNPASRRQLLCLQEVSDGTHEDEDGLRIGELTGRRVVLSYFSSILILSDSTKGDIERDVEASDSRSMATTLGIQDIQQASMLRMAALGKKVELFPPISEILDIRTANQMHLISQGYVMSNHLVASYLAMVSEDRSVNRIYGELLSCRGAEIQIRRFADYIKLSPGETLSFWDVFRIARGFKDLVIGYIEQHGDHDKELRRGLRLDSKNEHAKVLLNPENKRVPRAWHPEDRLILISLCRRAQIKAEMKAQRAKAEDDLRRTILSGADVAIHGWIKKLGAGHKKAIEMDDERSWRDRLAFVVDETMYYVSEKRRGEKEVVCKLDNIWHVEVGNGWPPGHYTFKIYIAPEDRNVERSSFSLESLPSRVFSAPTLEDCKAWITVLSRGGEFGEERDRGDDSPRRHAGPSGIVTIGDMHADTPKIPGSPVRMSVEVGSRKSVDASRRRSLEAGSPLSVKRSQDCPSLVFPHRASSDVLLSGGEEEDNSSTGGLDDEYVADPHPAEVAGQGRVVVNGEAPPA